MVPSTLTDYFAASSAVAGTLIGLLFVSITLRYDEIFGRNARSHTVAGAAFLALANALTIALWALLPHVNLGWPAAFIATFGVFATSRTWRRQEEERAASRGLFVLALVVYLYELANGIVLIIRPYDHAFISSLAYTLFASLVTGLTRSWQLIQPESQTPAPEAPTPATTPATSK